MDNYLKETELLNYRHGSIQRLIAERGWGGLPEKDRILEIYNFVRDEIKFGYNIDDRIPASEVLKDHYGQCNTKGILFMALLRAANVPCRLHGFTIDKKLQKGVINGLWYWIAPRELFHTWVELYYNNRWLNIEGFILDQNYLSSLQHRYRECTEGFCGFAVATKNFKNPDINWNEGSTYIQKEAITGDLGVYDDPDTYFSKYKQKLNPIKKFLYRNVIRYSMNRNVRNIRENPKISSTRRRGTGR